MLYQNKLDRLIRLTSPQKLNELKRSIVEKFGRRKSSGGSDKRKSNSFHTHSKPFDDQNFSSPRQNNADLSLDKSHFFRRRKTVVFNQPIARGLAESEKIKNIKDQIRREEEERTGEISPKGKV